ncbi:MAG: creatininase family protein [Eubacterium sp.]|nr:creatininase family protein [Eubacterium sp.]
MSKEEVDRQLREDFGYPCELEFGKAGVYIQTTPRHDAIENRRKNDVVLIPVGCTENHGMHNPSGMDTFMVCYIAEGVRRYTEKKGYPVNLAFPPLLYGCHPLHGIGQPGTIVVHDETAVDMVVDVMLGLWNDGYRKQILINNHGQVVQLEEALAKFTKEYQLPGIYRIVDWHRCTRELFAVKEWGGEFDTVFNHGDEIETGIGLLGFPDMVKMEYAVDAEAIPLLPTYHFDGSIDIWRRPSRWEDGEGYTVHELFGTPCGVVGTPTKADPEKLKRPMLGIMKYLVMLIDEYLEAYPPGTVPEAEKMTLRSNEEVADYLKEPLSEGWKSVYGLGKKCF